MTIKTLDLIVFLVYMLGIIGFGISFYFRKNTADDFVTGGGKLPAWALGMSIFATYVSSISFLALPGSAFQGNWNGFVFSLSIPIAAAIAVRYFVPLYRKLQSPSAYAFLEERFGPWARIYASSCYLLTQLARMGAIMYLLALPMHALFGWSIPMVVFLTGLGVMVYATLGGISAVVWTDAVQGVVLIAGALGCFLLIVYKCLKESHRSGRSHRGKINFPWVAFRRTLPRVHFGWFWFMGCLSICRILALTKVIFSATKSQRLKRTPRNPPGLVAYFIFLFPSCSLSSERAFLPTIRFLRILSLLISNKFKMPIRYFLFLLQAFCLQEFQVWSSPPFSLPA